MRAAASFSAASRSRGEAYFREGAVTIGEGSDSFILAAVTGTRRYRVELAEEDGALAVDCDCPHFVDEGANCKHVWATILAAEERGAFAGLAKRRGPVRIARAIEDDDPLAWVHVESGEPPDLEREIGAFARSQPRIPPKPPRTAPRRSWADLAGLPRAPSLPIPGGSRRERGYVVGINESRQEGGLAVFVEARNVSVNGVPMSPWRRVELREARAEPPPGESVLLELLAASRPPYPSYGYGGRDAKCVVPAPFAREACRMLAEAARAEVEGPAGERAPIRFDDGVPWAFGLEAEQAGRGQLVLRGVLRRGDERRWLSESWLVVAGAVVIWPETIARVEPIAGLEWLHELRVHDAIVVPRKEVARFLAFAAEGRVPVALPEPLRLERVALSPSPILRLERPRSDYGASRTTGRVVFGYGEWEVGADESTRARVDADARRVLLRDDAAERTAIERFMKLGFRASHWARSFEIASPKLPAAVRALVTDGWRVEGEGKVYRVASSFEAIVSSGIDWFDLRASARFGDADVPLPRLLSALRRGEHTVVLGDGSVGLLPEDWLSRWANVASMGEVDGEQVRFTRSQGALLDALLASEPEARFDERFDELRTKLRAFDGVRPARAPKGFRGELRDYQSFGLAWMRALGELGLGGCLADDMGLGKTVQVLALLAGRRRAERAGPSLVVAPKSVVFNWRDETARFAPSLRVLDHTGSARMAPGAHFADHDIVLTTYGTLRRDIAALREIAFDYAILDEAQTIKNASSASAKAARLLRARHRLALSGTPIENHLGELWSLFEFLNPGMLGAVTAFKRFAGSRSVDDASMTTLARAIRPFVLRRTKKEVAKELPDRIDQVVHCELERDQRGLYDELKAHYRASLLSRARREGVGRMTTHVLEALLRLRQAACHPGLIDPARANEPSAKLETLLAQLESVVAEGHKALVFSQFTSLLAIVRARIEAKGVAFEYLDGQTRDRAARVERFQRDDACRVFLVSLKAGGVGLNLTAAAYVFLLDPWWNPAVEAQAIDRAHRIGQQRTVFAYRLIATDTVEERVLDLQRQKRALVEGLFGADGRATGLRGMTAEDLEVLLS